MVRGISLLRGDILFRLGKVLTEVLCAGDGCDDQGKYWCNDHTMSVLGI